MQSSLFQLTSDLPMKIAFFFSANSAFTYVCNLFRDAFSNSLYSFLDY